MFNDMIQKSGEMIQNRFSITLRNAYLADATINFHHVGDIVWTRVFLLFLLLFNVSLPKVRRLLCLFGSLMCPFGSIP